MGNGVTTVAVVSHPGNGAQEITSRLQDEEASLNWRHMPEVYMLGRNTPDEQVTYDYLLGKGSEGYPDGILALVNANELSRQLYLVSQLIDLRLPLVIGVVSIEEAGKAGISIDVSKMAAQFGVQGFVFDQDNESLASFVTGLKDALDNPDAKRPLHWRPSIALADAYNVLDKKWVYKHLKLHSGARLIEGLRLLTIAKAMEEYQDHPAYEELVALINEARTLLEGKNENWNMAEVLQRNSWIGQIVGATTTREELPVKNKPPFWKRMLGAN